MKKFYELLAVMAELFVMMAWVLSCMNSPENLPATGMMIWGALTTADAIRRIFVAFNSVKNWLIRRRFKRVSLF